MYLKIIIDTSGNTQIRNPDGDLNIKCPFCKNKNTYIFNSDSSLYCNSCGNLLITRIEESEFHTEEEIDESIRILKYGASVYDRRDAAVCLGKVSENKRLACIIELLSLISSSDPDREVRENAMEALAKLQSTVPCEKDKMRITEETSSKNVEIAEKEESQIYKEPEAEYKAKSKFSMEEELLSLLDDSPEDKAGLNQENKTSIPLKASQEFGFGQENKPGEIHSSYRTLKLDRRLSSKDLPSVPPEEKRTAPGKKAAFNLEDELLALLEDI